MTEQSLKAYTEAKASEHVELFATLKAKGSFNDLVSFLGALPR